MTSPDLDDLGYLIADSRLDNGLRVIVNPDPSSPAVAVNLWYSVGSRDEVAGRTGFAHLFEHLMFQGTWTGVGVGEHLAAVQAAGGDANATTSMDRTNYFETVQPGALELALWLESQRMTALKVDQTNLDNQREVVKEEKRQRYDNVPYGDTYQTLMEFAFPAGHPYQHTPIGSMADLDAASLDDVQAFYAHWYCASNATVVLSGAVDAETGLRLADQYFGHLPSVPRPERAPVPPVATLAGRQRTLHRDVPRDTVHLLWPAPALDHADAAAVDVALSLLAGTQSARLHQRLVRELELAEGLSASTLGLMGGTNVTVVSARAREGRPLDEVRDALLSEITALPNQVTEAEVDRSRAQAEREWLLELSTVDDRADEIQFWTAVTGDPTTINRHLGHLTSVTPADVASAARAWLAPAEVGVLHYLSEETR